MKQLIILLLILFFSEIHAEIISGPANIRVGKNEKIILTINDSTNVACSELKDDWYSIIISIKVTEEYYNGTKKLKKGDKIFNWENEEIGLILDEVPEGICEIWSSGGAPGNPKKFGIELHCFTHRNNIYPESIVENCVEYKINVDKNFKQPEFSNLLTKFNFILDNYLKKDYPEISEYYMQEQFYDSPTDRIRLIFEQENLLAIVFTRKLEINNLETYELKSGKKIMFFRHPKELNVESLMEKYNELFKE